MKYCNDANIISLKQKWQVQIWSKLMKNVESKGFEYKAKENERKLTSVRGLIN